MDKSTEAFDAWCIVELFGHVTLAGRVTEQTVGGCSFVRLDVPEAGGQPAFTKLIGQGAIYSITPVSEDVARAANERIRPKPVNTYYLPAPAAANADPEPERDDYEYADPEPERDDYEYADPEPERDDYEYDDGETDDDDAQ